jgi:hypothetical protein
LAATVEGGWRALHFGGSPPLTTIAVWLSSLEVTIDISRARAELGYRPVKDRAAGLAELAAGEATTTAPKGMAVPTDTGTEGVTHHADGS